MISYSVAQRTHEIGVRMALGAERRDVLGMILGHGIRIAGAGVVIGVEAAFGLNSFNGAASFLRERRRSSDVRRGRDYAAVDRDAGVLHSRSANFAGGSDDRAAVRVKTRHYVGSR